MKPAAGAAPTNNYIWTALQQTRWRALVLVVCFTAALAIVVIHKLLPFEDLIEEVVIYGLIIPFISLLILARFAKRMERRARQDEMLEHRRQFVAQLAQRQGWHELTRFIVQSSATLLPVDHSSLFIYDHRRAQLDFVTEWNANGRLYSPVNSYLTGLSVCHVCILTKPLKMQHMAECVTQQTLPGGEYLDDYCLPLSRDSLLVGILRLRCRAGKQLNTDQCDFMKDIAPEIAIALALLLAHPRQIELARLEAQAAERRRIAFELHNSLAQQIGYIQLKLDGLMANEQLAALEGAQQVLSDLRWVTKDAYGQIRNNLRILQSLREIVVPQELAEYVQSIAQRANLTIELTTVGEPIPLPSALYQEIFFLVQEGLNNVEKHACAHRVQILLSWSRDSLTISMPDDGIGFDLSAVPRGQHYGLELMRERVNALKGNLTIDSCPGNGTRLTFQIPLQHLRTGNPSSVSNLSAPAPD